MRITSFSVRNPQFTLVAFLLLAALGVWSFLHIPRSEDPYFPTPNFGITAIYPGATPAEIERTVLSELEEELSALGEVKRIRAVAGSSVAFVEVEFEPGVDTVAKDNDLRRQVEAARARFPAGVRDVVVRHFETTNVAVLQLAVTAPADAVDDATLEREVDRLVRRLEAVPGVKDVGDHGVRAQIAAVELDLGRLARHQLGAGAVLGALSAGNTSIPGGDVTIADTRLAVESSGGYAGVAELAAAVVAPGTGQVVRVGDVAEVGLRSEDESTRARISQRGADGVMAPPVRAAFVTVMMRDGENIFAVRSAALAAVAEARRGLPPGLGIDVGFDQSRNVAHRLGGLQRDFLIAIVLVLVTLVPLGLRASLVVMVSIPLSLAIGVGLLFALGYSLNQLSIVGFVVALGLLVDDSIVVAENIARHLRDGKRPVEAAIAASRQIGLAVVGCTATLIFAFVPLLFLPGNAGTFIRSMPVAVVVTIAASLLVSLTLIPFLASRLMRGEHHDGNWAFRAMSRGIEWAYRPVLAQAMRRPALTLALCAAFVVGAVALVPRIGFSLFPKAGIPQFMIEVAAPDGTSLDGTDVVVREVEAALAAEPEVRAVLTTVGAGNPQVYYNVGPRPAAPSTADLFVQLRRYDAAITPAVLDRLRARVARIPGAEITVREFEQGPPIDAPIAIRLFSDDLDELRRQAARVAAALRGVPGTRDVRDPLAVQTTGVAVELDAGRAALAGVAELEVDRAVRLAVAGLTLGTVRQPGGDEVDLVVRLARAPGAAGADLGAIERLELASTSGVHVPMAQVAELVLQPTPRQIQHHDRQRVATITAEVDTTANAQVVSAKALAAVGALELPAGARWEAGGLVESQKESFAGLGPAVLIALFGVLAILVLEFGSFAATLIVASVIPLGAAGGLVALWLAGETLSFTASIGFVALIGIEVKNSILLVDFTNQLRAQGVPLDDAIRQAGEARFFPILLTSLTAIGGLVPLVLEHSALYSPLALVLIGGLVASTVLSRLVTPVMSRLLLDRDGGRVGALPAAMAPG